MKKTATILLLTLICSTTITGQGQFGQVTPQTAEFMRYGETQVSFYTGKINLQIPIYHIKDRDFDMPISLGYTSEAFNPNSRAGIVGYNWFLNTGGVITREIYGAPDDSRGDEGYKSKGYWFASAKKKYSRQDLVNHMNSSLEGLPLIDRCDYDCQPDLFLFNFNGHSGQFMANNSREIITNHKGYKADLSGLGEQMPVGIDGYRGGGDIFMQIIRSEIKVTTPEGYIYVFGGGLDALEVSKPFTPGVSIDYFDSTILGWHLSSIIAPNGRRMNFKYKVVSNLERNNPIWQSSFIKSPESHMAIKTAVLESIEIPDTGNKIVFEYSEGNDSFFLKTHNDFNGSSYQLDKIIVKSGNDTKYTTTLSYEYKGKRRFLNKVNVKGTDIYKFDYDHITYPEAQDRDADLDHWGLWKSAGTSNSYGLLKKVEYPTKGYTEFTYEKHKYGHRINSDIESFADPKFNPVLEEEFSYAGGARIKKISNYNKTGEMTGEKEYFYVRDYKYNITKEANPGSGSSGGNSDIDGPQNPSGQEDGDTPNPDFDPDPDLDPDSLPLLPRPDLEPNTKSSGIFYPIKPYIINDESNNKLLINAGYNAWRNNFNVSESHIGYSEVTEKFSNGTYIRYLFTDYYSIPNQPYDIRIKGDVNKDIDIKLAVAVSKLGSKSAHRGLLKEKLIYSDDKSNNPVAKETIGYNFPNGVNIGSVEEPLGQEDNSPGSSSEANPLIISSFYCADPPTSSNNDNGVYVLRDFSLSYSPIKSKTEEKDSISTVYEYGYNSLDMLSSEKIKPENSRAKEINYKYATDYTTSPYTLMSSSNAIGLPVEETTNVNGTRIHTLKRNYVQLDTGITSNKKYAVSSVETATRGSLTTEEEYLYDRKNGNLIQIKTRDGISTACLWSYNNQYPIAEIIGATHQEVKTALGYTDAQIDVLGSNNKPDVSSIDVSLRNYFKGKPVMITTYTYTPLVGIKTICTAQGVTTYNYDAFGRLINITDCNGKVVEEYNYNYRTQ